MRIPKVVWGLSAGDFSIRLNPYIILQNALLFELALQSDYEILRDLVYGPFEEILVSCREEGLS
jgi:hypothetical protein